MCSGREAGAGVVVEDVAPPEAEDEGEDEDEDGDGAEGAVVGALPAGEERAGSPRSQPAARATAAAAIKIVRRIRFSFDCADRSLQSPCREKGPGWLTLASE